MKQYCSSSPVILECLCRIPNVECEIQNRADPDFTSFEKTVGKGTEDAY